MIKKPTSKDEKDFLAPYEAHGLDFKRSTKHGTAECPFCEGDTFSVVRKDGRFRCPKCNATGNVYSFLSKYHQLRLSETSKKDRIRLKKLRGGFIPTSVFQKFKIAVDDDGNFLFPIQNGSSKNLVQLRRWVPSTKIFYNTAELDSQLFFATKLQDTGPVFICEGEFDAIALSFFFQKGWTSKEVYSIVAVPGAGTFKEQWIKQFDGRTCYLLFDNDHDRKNKQKQTYNPAKDGIQRVVKLFNEHAKSNKTSLKIIDWNKSKKSKIDGYDIQDYCKDNLKIPRRAIKRLISWCNPADMELKGSSDERVKIEPLECNSFEELKEHFSKHLNTNQEFFDVLSATLAVTVSIRVAGNPLWLYIVGPASSGKTTIIDMFEACTEFSEHLSTLTSTTLVSGMKGDAGEDFSFLPQMKNKTLFIKDLTAIMSMPSGVQDELYGMLRDIYDGRFKRVYGNGKVCDYKDLYMNLCAGVTHVIHGDNRSSLGERFLKIEILPPNFNTVGHEEHIRKGLENVGKKNEFTEVLQGYTLGFMNTLHHNTKPLPEMPAEIENKLVALCQIVGRLRTKVDNKQGVMAYRPEHELGTRVAQQLKKFLISLAIVFQKDVIDDQCYQVVKKIALDSSIGFPLEVIQTMIRCNRPMDVREISETMGNISDTHVNSILKNQLILGNVRYKSVSNNSGRKGRNTREFIVEESLLKLWRSSKLGREKPKQTPSNKSKHRRKSR